VRRPPTQAAFGSKFPLDQLHDGLKCPNCGERRVRVYFEVPGEPKARAEAGAAGFSTLKGKVKSGSDVRAVHLPMHSERYST
jgi:hypothetical protein